MTDNTNPASNEAPNPAVEAARVAAHAKAAGTAVPPTPQAAHAADPNAAPQDGAPPAQPAVPDTGAAGAPPAEAAPEVPQLGEPGAGSETPLEAEQSGEAVQYKPTGDAAMDVALAFVGRMGITPDDPAMLAAGQGNFALIEAKLAAMGDKAAGWQQHVALARGSYEAAVKTADTAKAASTKAIHEAVGGEANLQPILKWASSVASPEEKAYFNAQLSGTPIAAANAARELKRLYEAASGTVVNPAATTSGQPGTVAPGPQAPLTRKEYTAQVNAISRKVGAHNLTQSPEYQALAQRFLSQR